MRVLSSYIGFLLLGAACSPSGITVHHRGAPIVLHAIAVAPVAVHLVGAQSWHVYQKTSDVLNTLDRRPRLDAIAPWEFRVVGGSMEETTDYGAGSDLFPRAERMGIQAQHIGVLMVSVQEASASQVTDIQRGGASGRRKDYNSQLSAHAELRHAISNQLIAELSLSRDEDRFAALSDHDPRPEVTRLVRDVTTQLLDALDAQVIVAEAPLLEPTAGLQESPAPMLNYRVRTATLAEHLAGLDPIMRDAQRYEHFRYFHPNLTLNDLATLMEPGVYSTAGVRHGCDVNHLFQLHRELRRGRCAQ